MALLCVDDIPRNPVSGAGAHASARESRRRQRLAHHRRRLFDLGGGMQRRPSATGREPDHRQDRPPNGDTDRPRQTARRERHASGRLRGARAREYPSLSDDESYQLDVSSEGARLKAATGAGALHGLETFVQLIESGPSGFHVAAVHIEDRPRFPWRGLMLDVSRHWMPLEVVERNLNAMAAVKLNVFHWHLSDDQGFRVESKRFPRLQELGSDGHFYTQDQIREVVAYARDRGIRVVPEFDIPGHTQSWLAGLSGAGQRARTLRNRAHLGRLRSRHGSHPRGRVSIPRRLPR